MSLFAVRGHKIPEENFGPLLDRIDLQVKVGKVNISELRIKKEEVLASPDIKARIETARLVQRKRFAKIKGGRNIAANAEMSSRQVELMANLDPVAEKFLETLDKSRLSPRGYYRLLKVARTIADLEENDNVTADYLAEAYSYRLREEV